MIKDYNSNLILGKRNDDNIIISFVIPTYNRLNTLKETVESIIPNGKISYEIIVVDNSDLNNTKSTKEYFIKKNIRHLCYYVNEKNYGMVGNWNCGLNLSKGKFVSYIHDDDVLDKNYFDIIYDLISSIDINKIGFIKAKFNNFSNLSDIGNYDDIKFGSNRIRKIESLINGIGPSGPPTCGIIFNKEVLIKIGGFNEYYYPCADHIVGFDILNLGYNGYVTKGIVGHYRWGLNETLNKNTLIETVEKNFIIREHIYRNNFFYTLFGFIFKKYQYTYDVKTYMVHAKRFNQDISLNEMIKRNEYYIDNILLYKFERIVYLILSKCIKMFLKLLN